jgi:hypothetical protein
LRRHVSGSGAHVGIDDKICVWLRPWEGARRCGCSVHEILDDSLPTSKVYQEEQGTNIEKKNVSHPSVTPCLRKSRAVLQRLPALILPATAFKSGCFITSWGINWPPAIQHYLRAL